jgi:radical SAM-linked protein
MAVESGAPMWVELTYRKEGVGRFLAHLDVLRAFERAVRRAELPIALTEGFNPRPRIVFASPLGIGATGEAEIVALQLRAPMALGEVLTRLQAQAAVGLTPTEARSLPGPKPPAYHLIPWAIWRIETPPPGPSVEELEWRVRKLLARQELPFERKTKSGTTTVDLRAGVFEVAPAGEGLLNARLALNGEHTAKPLELVEALGLARGDAATPHPLLHRVALATAPAR